MSYLHLIDNMTGADIDLLQNPNYSFVATINDYESRFRLVFSASSTGSETDVPFAFISNGNIVIIGANVDSMLQIVDVTGRVLATRDGLIQCVPTTGMAKGVYVLRLINGNDVKTQKIVIR